VYLSWFSTFPFGLEGAEVTSGLFCDYLLNLVTVNSTGISGVELESFRGMLAVKFRPPGPDGKLYGRQLFVIVMGRKVIPALFWFGL